MEKEKKAELEFLKDKVFLLIKENAELEERVKELERVVRELIRYKKSIKEIEVDNELNPIGFIEHDFKF